MKPTVRKPTNETAIIYWIFFKAFFSPYYHIPENNLYCLLTSGRFEVRNKGFDVLLEALVVLNEMLKQAKSGITVFQILISAQETAGCNPQLLESKSRMLDLRRFSRVVGRQVGSHLYRTVVSRQSLVLPDLNEVAEDEIVFQWRGIVQDFKLKGTPPISKHRLNAENEILNICQRLGLSNEKSEHEKVIYHPEFVRAASSLFGLDYQDLLSACDAAVFPSLYEPWAHAGMEAVLAGKPVFLSNRSGFARYLKDQGLLNNQVTVLEAVNPDERPFELAEKLFRVITSGRRPKEHFQSLKKQLLERLNWDSVQNAYHDLYQLAAIRKYGASGLY